MKKQKQVKKPTKLDLVREQIVHDYVDRSTNDLVRRRMALSYAAEVREAAVADLSAQVAEERKQLGKLGAQIAGLDEILGRR